MEYRRRKRRRKAARARGGAGSPLLSLIALALISGAVYFAATSNAGDWVAKNVMAPVVAFFGGGGPNIEEEPGELLAEAPPSQEPLDFSSGGEAAPVSAEMSLPALECYALQMGVYSSYENAASEAESLQARGAAGYIVEEASIDGARYRVLAAGYADEASARSVRESLAAAGTDSALYTLEAPSATFRVTAGDSALPGVRAGFEAFAAAQTALTGAAIRFDGESMSIAEGQALASGILTALEGDMASLIACGEDGGALSMILSAYANVSSSLRSLIEANYQSTVDFSAAMKYTQLYVTDQYAALINELTD